ncbi:MAG: BrnT family toxin [Bacteroidetes bacterium SW_9_63_38]|nr:MAG: BrnT family toxin [Bacteroidetes bacterium SW_9_63_38]
MNQKPAGFEWDDDKRELNIENHSVDFIDAVQVFTGPHFIEDRTREEDGELRKGAIGPIPGELTPDHWSGELIIVVFTWRSDTIRLISARRADTDGRRRYESHFGGSKKGRE